MKIRTLAVLIVITAFCCAGGLQELPRGDKYSNEAVGHLRVQNTSTEKSPYVITAVELRNSAGEVIKIWEGLELLPGATWTGDLDLEGSFILYCTVWNEDERAAGCYEYGAVTIKLHEVTESQIIGESFFTDTDGDGFSDFWEKAHEDEGFNLEDPSDGGTVYVSATALNDEGKGTAANPYRTLAKALEKAKAGLTEAARTVVVIGTLTRVTEGTASTSASMVSIIDTGLHGVTVVGEGSALIDARKPTWDADGKRALCLGPGTKLTLKNITVENGYGYQGGGIYVDGAELTLGAGAVIQKCYGESGALSGGGVFASGGGVIVMKDGSLISENKGLIGVGVALLNGSSLTMEAGSRITDNLFERSGAVAADLGSRVTLEPGAEISGNNDNVTAQTPYHGGGVRLTGGSKLIMEGGLITGNSIAKGGGGGGVYVGPESVLEMKGGEISGNTVKGNGGGVYVDSGGTFSMIGGFISKNTTADKGGGVYIDGGSFAKTGGTVYGSDAFGERNTAGEANGTGKGHALFDTTKPDEIKDTTLPEAVTL
jgi:hypothetical protein